MRFSVLWGLTERWFTILNIVYRTTERKTNAPLLASLCNNRTGMHWKIYCRLSVALNRFIWSHKRVISIGTVTVLEILGVDLQQQSVYWMLRMQNTHYFERIFCLLANARHCHNLFLYQLRNSVYARKVISQLLAKQAHRQQLFFWEAKNLLGGGKLSFVGVYACLCDSIHTWHRPVTFLNAASSHQCLPQLFIVCF